MGEHGGTGGSRGEVAIGSIDSQGVGGEGRGGGGGVRGLGGGGVVPYGDDLSQPGKKGKKECSYVIDCLQKKKCDRDLFCQCQRGKCISMRTSV